MIFTPKIDRFATDAIIPGRVADENGWVFTGNVWDGLRGELPIYLSVTGLRQIASRFTQVGLEPAEKLIEAQSLIHDLKREVQRLEFQVSALEAQQARISGLVADGFKVQKVPGRPKASV